MRKYLVLPVLAISDLAFKVWGVGISAAIVAGILIVATIATVTSYRYERDRAARLFSEDPDVEVEIHGGCLGRYWIGLLDDSGRPASKRRSGQVEMGDGVRFPKRIELTPTDEWESVAVWENNESHGHPPLAIIHRWMIEVTESDNKVVVGG